MSSRPTLLFATLLLAALGGAHGCSLNVSDPSQMPIPQPLLLKPRGSHDVHGFVTPDPSGQIFLADGQQITLACPDNAISVTGKPLGTATCVSDSTFSIDGKDHSFADLKCNNQPLASAERTGRRCGSSGQYQVINLGFQVGSDFYTLIEVCFDGHNFRTVYDNFTMVAQIAGRQTGFSWDSWFQGSFFPNITNVRNQYIPATQLKTVEELLGSNELANKYINVDKGNYLTAGQLASNSDFMLGAQSVATFQYLNAAPQWRHLNHNNWKIMENNVQSYANKKSVSLQIYTGTHGIMTLKNVDNHKTEVYLYAVGNKKYIPVPKIFWKIVYNANTKAAVVFIGVNNPYINEPDSDYFVCQDVCSQISWIKWHPTDQEKGYSRCCKYGDFKNAVADAPDLAVDSLLTDYNQIVDNSNLPSDVTLKPHQTNT